MLSFTVRGRARAQVPVAMRQALRRQLVRAMQAAKVGHTQVCLSLSDDDELCALNRQYAGEDHPTDVLSFSQRESRSNPHSQPHHPAMHALPPQLEGVPEPLGDIVISVEYAARQAVTQGHELLAELVHLSVHGLCHLLGFDHRTPEEERVMFGYEATLREQARGVGKVKVKTDLARADLGLGPRRREQPASRARTSAGKRASS